MRLLLDIGLRKFKGIVKNHGIAVRLDHGTKGIACDRLGIKELKSQAINFITELAETEGETHATRFMREEHKLFIRDAELNTIELPSHCTKRRIYRNYCWVNGWRSETNARGDLELLERPYDDDSFPIGSPLDPQGTTCYPGQPSAASGQLTAPTSACVHHHVTLVTYVLNTK